MIITRMWWLNNTNQGLTAVKAEKEVECQVERAALGWHRHRFDHLFVKLTPAPFIVWTKYMYKVIVICINPWKVLYNIGVSLLHARRPSVAFDILLEVTTTHCTKMSAVFKRTTSIFKVVGAHYLDPHVWFHLAECCLMAGQVRTFPNRPVAQNAPQW